MNSSVEKSEPCQVCEFQENLNILRDIYFFSVLPLEVLKVFAYLCTREKFKTGDYLFTQDDDDGQAFFFISGQAELIRTDNGVDETIRTYDTGDFSGALSLLSNIRRLFSLKATSPVICLILNREKFIHTMDQHPQYMGSVFQAIIEKIHDWEEMFILERSTGCNACRRKIGVSLI